MANNLTGDFDAVVQVSVKAINGIVATIHQNGGSDTSPSFLHSFALQIGEKSELMAIEAQQLSHWTNLVLQNQGISATENKAETIVKRAPPGISKALFEAVRGLEKIEAEPVSPGTERGLAQVQLSNPSVSFIEGSTSTVLGRIKVRANYIPDPGTAALPQPVNGEIQIVLTLQVSAKPGFDTNVLEVGFPANDNDIQFTPASGTGLDAASVNKLEAHIRAALRKGFQPTNLELPEGFQFNQFRAIGSGDNQIAAFPVQLSGGSGPPANAINGLSNHFLSYSDGFGIAVSKEFVLSMVQPQLDAIKSSHPQFTISSFAGSATYTTNFNVAAASWVGGKIKLNIQGNSTTPTWWAPNVSSFSIQQNLFLQFNANSQNLVVVPEGQPSVNVNVNGPFGGLVEGSVTPTVRNAFTAERDKALNEAEAQIQQVFSGAGSINDALKAFDSATHGTYTSLDTNNDGFILHGRIYTRQRPGPIVQVTKTGDGNAFTALKSWIPGGVIERFEWSWVKKGQNYIPWSNTVETAAEEHSFILPKPSGISTASEVCLYLKGKHIFPGSSIPQAIVMGTELDVQGGDTCSVNGPEFVFTMPAWWVTIMTPLWLVDPPPEAVLAESMSGHVESVSQMPGEIGANTVVYFSDLQGGSPFDDLNQAFADMNVDNIPMALALVLPQGSFRQQRREMERKLGSLDKFNGSVFITEDYQFGWSKTFGANSLPAIYFTNARGEFKWQQSGKPDIKAVSRALRQHFISAPQPKTRPLSLSFKVGDRVPDALLETMSGDQLALRKLQDRPIVLYFWQSWSEPCVKDLMRLESRHKEDNETLILAINGGESHEDIAKFMRKQEISITVVSDTEQRITQRYGVRCWPTTVSIDNEGVVNNIRFGVAHSFDRKYEESCRI